LASGEGKDWLAKHAAAVARQLWGEPNKQLSSKDELRFGKQGSVSVMIETGEFFDHEAKEGGGVLWAIERMTGQTVEGGHAIQWLRDNGYYVEDRESPPPAGGGSAPRSTARFDRNGVYLPKRVPDHGVMTKAYDYHAADGTLLYQSCRYEWAVDHAPGEKDHEKTFSQRRPDASRKDGWDYSVKGMVQVPYRLPELIEDIAQGYEIFIVEGEKKVDLLRDVLGVPATCNSGGSGKFPDDLLDYFRGARVTIIPDNDEAGETHVRVVGNALTGLAERIRVLRLPGVPAKGSVDDWIPAGGTAEQLYELAAGAPLFEATPYESKFGAVTWAHLDDPGPAHEWLIKGILTRNELSMLAGASQSGKTFLALSLVMAVARGVDWFGHRTVHGGVVYCAPEGSTGLRSKRLPAYRRHHDLKTSDPIPFVLLPHALDLHTSDQQTNDLIDEVKHWARTFPVPLELVVIDTFSKATPGMRENESAEVSRVLERCDRIRRATGAHVLLVHHLNADGEKPRGHTSIFANLENVLISTKLADRHDREGRVLREVKLAKQKEGEDGKAIKFVLQVVDIGIDADGDPRTSCVVVPPAGSANTEVADEGVTVGGKTAVVLRAIYEAIEAKGVFADPSFNLPQGTLMVDRKEISHRVAQLDLGGDDEGEDAPAGDQPEDAGEAEKRAKAARRKAIERARDTLYSRDVIGINGQWIWLTGKRVRGFGRPPGTKAPASRAPADDAPREPLPFDEGEF